MNVLDITLLSLTLIGIIWGARKGFIGILVLVIGIVATIILIDAFGTPLSSFFEYVGVGKDISYAVSVLTIMVVSLIVFFIIYLLLKNLIDLFRVGIINRILGALLGGWVLFILFGSFLFFFSKIPFLGFRKYIDTSLVAKYSYEHSKSIMSLSGAEEKVEKVIEGQ
ncbi:MAG: CvpA family protein [Spirochaetes bacterium]|nr:CvpA family protein [Spirochaetota bacterium]